MTQSAAPIPAGTVVDISPAGAVAPLPPAPAVPDVVWTGKVTVGRYQYDLVTRLSIADMVAIQEAQDSRKLRLLIDVLPRTVIPAQRQQLTDYLWSEPEVDEDKLELDDAFGALGEAIEQINNRPPSK